jgi:hypothetical protein
MFQLREIIAVLCLVLLAWTLVAPVAGHDLLIILPVVAMLCVAATAIELPNSTEIRFRVLDPSLLSILLRAPPR